MNILHDFFFSLSFWNFLVVVLPRLKLVDNKANVVKKPVWTHFVDPLLCDEAVGFLPVLLIVVHFDPSVGLLVPETAEVVSDPLF